MSDWRGGRIILLSKETDHCRRAWEIAREAFGDALEIHSGKNGDPEPDLVSGERPAFLISFLSPWIVRQPALDHADMSLNFHPASADYPGSGCYNFALYEGAKEYGAVCHVMLAKVDTGRIVEERCFPVAEDESVETLKLKTMDTMLEIFRSVVGMIVRGEELPTAPRQWTRRPFRFREMETLRRITPDMSEEEVQRRLRAMTYPGFPGCFRENEDGSIHHYPVPDRPPIA